MDPKGHTEAITEIVQEGLPGVPGMRLQSTLYYVVYDSYNILFLPMQSQAFI